MTNKPIRRFMLKFRVLALFLALALYVAPSLAHDVRIILAEAKFISLDQAVKRVKVKQHAKVLSAKTVQIDGDAVHVVKVLTKAGRVKKIRINSIPRK
jgi:predicted phosphatase